MSPKIKCRPVMKVGRTEPAFALVDRLAFLPTMVLVDLDEAGPDPKDLVGPDGDIGSLARRASGGFYTPQGSSIHFFQEKERAHGGS